MVLSVRRRIQLGMGLFCLIFLASFFFIMKVLCEGCSVSFIKSTSDSISTKSNTINLSAQRKTKTIKRKYHFRDLLIGPSPMFSCLFRLKQKPPFIRKENPKGAGAKYTRLDRYLGRLDLGLHLSQQWAHFYFLKTFDPSKGPINEPDWLKWISQKAYQMQMG